MKKIKIEYHDDDTLLEGYCCYNDQDHHKKAAVLVFHDWSGKNEFACQKAQKLAELGYVGFAVDMYGKGKLGKTKEEKQNLMSPLVNDRKKLQKRAYAAFAALKKQDFVDPYQIGAIGFCFGGLCALDLARMGAPLKGVVSFHGDLRPPQFQEQQQIQAKILVLHGYDDPLVKHEQIPAFAEEMTRAKVDWEIDIYGHTMHGFTNPEANDPNFGTVYSKEADRKSWVAMKHFFADLCKSD